MTRRTTAAMVTALVVALLALDLMAFERPDIHAQPPVIAFGSGAVAAGAHCASLPTS